MKKLALAIAAMTAFDYFTQGKIPSAASVFIEVLILAVGFAILWDLMLTRVERS